MGPMYYTGLDVHKLRISYCEGRAGNTTRLRKQTESR